MLRQPPPYVTETPVVRLRRPSLSVMERLQPYGEGRSAGVATLLVEVSLGRYRTATRLYGYYRLLLDVSSRLDLVRWDSTWTGVFW